MTDFFLKYRSILLLIQVFVVSSCSLCYELILSTGISNITGNSVLAFSLSIGLFLAGLGTGAFSTRWVKDELLKDTFVTTETVLALVGGIAVILLYFGLIFTPYFQLIQVALTFIIGFTSGLEIPILTRILNLSDDADQTGIQNEHKLDLTTEASSSIRKIKDPRRKQRGIRYSNRTVCFRI